MRRFPLFISVLALSSCVTSGHQTVSGWYALAKAKNVQCGTWPMREKDLQLDEIELARYITGTGVRGGGFLVTGLKRDASPLHYFAPFKDDPQVDLDDFQPMKLDPGSVIVGGEELGGIVLANVIRNSADQAGHDRARLQIRRVKDNVLRGEGELGAFHVVEGQTVFAAGGAFVSYKSEDNVYHVAWVSLKDSKADVKVLAPTFRDRPEILVAPGRPGAALLSKDAEGGKPFRLQVVGADQSISPPLALDVPVTTQVESWTATTVHGGFYMAVVDGDSMIGAADLELSYVDWTTGGAAVRWTRAQPLKDVHATEPVFLSGKDGLEVLLLNWIDEESTIARYKVAGGTVDKPAYSGLFQKGTRIVSAFTGEDPGDLYVVTRQRDDTRWKFQICEI